MAISLNKKDHITYPNCKALFSLLLPNNDNCNYDSDDSAENYINA